MIVTSTTGSKAINSLIGISARMLSSRDKIELKEVERALVDHLPLNNLREKGLLVMLVPFLPLSRCSKNKFWRTTESENESHFIFEGTMFVCAYSSSWSELDPPCRTARFFVETELKVAKNLLSLLSMQWWRIFFALGIIFCQCLWSTMILMEIVVNIGEI